MNSKLIRCYEGKELASEYEKYRPKYTKEMAERIMKEVHVHRRPDSNNKLGKMLDVGCGGGQTTRLLGQYFHSSLGIDISLGQLTVAGEKTKEENIKYQHVDNGKFPVEDNSIDFVVCGASVHWLDFAEFESECERVLKPHGVVAVFSYYLTKVVYIKSGKSLNCGDDFAKFFSDFNNTIKIHPRNRMYLERYRPVFEHLSSSNKRWVEGITLPSITTFHGLRNFFSSEGEYHDLMKTNPEIDPLDVLMKNLKELWNLEGENEESIILEKTIELDLIMFNRE